MMRYAFIPYKIRVVASDKKIAGLVAAGFVVVIWCILMHFRGRFRCCMLCIFIQLRKKLVLSMVLSIFKFGITYILPNNSWILWCLRSARLVVYPVHAQCMQCHAAVAIRRPASRAIIHGARWCVVCVSFSVSGCTPSPIPPRGAGKTGRLSGDGPCVTTHSLLRLPAKHRPARKLDASSSQVQRTGNARSVCSTCVYRVFSAARA